MEKFLHVMLCTAVTVSLAGCQKMDQGVLKANPGSGSGGLTEAVTETIVSDIVSGILEDTDKLEDGSTTKRQEVRVMPAENDSEVRVIDDNHVVKEYMQNTILLVVREALRMQSLPALPDGAKALYHYELWQEDLDSVLTGAERPLLKAYTAGLYKDPAGFYLGIELSDEMEYELGEYFENGRCYAALEETTGAYLLGLAEGNPESSVSGSETDRRQEEGGEPADFYLSARSDIDYEGVASVSKKQKIEIIPAGEETTAFSLTDLKEITEFLKKEDAGAWEFTGSIPADAEKVCDVIRYAQARRTADKRLVEQYRDVLYQNTDGYFVEVVEADSGMYEGDDKGMRLCFKVPEQTGDYISGFCKQQGDCFK